MHHDRCREDESNRIVDLERQKLPSLVHADKSIAWQLHANTYQLIVPGGRTFSKEE